MNVRELFLSLKYARRELRSGLGGFYIFLACLVLGVAAIAAVRSLSLGMVESLHYDGRYILGGDIALRTIYEPATQEQLAFLKKEMGPTTVVMETRAMARRTDEEKATLVELKAVDVFYPLYGEMEIVDGAGKPVETPVQDLLVALHNADGTEIIGEWGALIEKELLGRLGLSFGDFIHVGNMKFQIRGIIAREPDRVGSIQFSLAPRIMISSMIFDATGLSTKGNQVYYDQRIYMPYIKTPEMLAAAQKKITDAFPDANWRGRNFYNASPQIERWIDRLAMFLGLIGLTTLLVGGVGISNAVRAYLDAKLSAIATLKCLGASGKFAFSVYIAQILFLAALGILGGLALGAAIARSAGHFLTAHLSLSDKVGVYPEALGLAALFGLLTTLAFSFWPLGRAIRVSPADLFRDAVVQDNKRPSASVMLGVLIFTQLLILLAITSSSDQRFAVWFTGGTLAALVLFYSYAALLKALLARLRLPTGPELRMAMANLHRPGNVSSSIILSLGLGLTVLVAIALVEFNFSRLLKSDLAQDAPSFFFLDIQPAQKDAFTALMAKQPTARKLQMTPSLRGRIVSVNGVPSQQALVDQQEAWVIRSDRGFTYTGTLPPYSRITAGEWWPADYQGPPRVSIATAVARAFDIGVGATLTVNILGRDVTATVANVREIDWASFTMNFAVTFAPGALEDFPAGYLSTVIIDPDSEEAMQAAIARDFPNVTSVRVKEALAAAEIMIRAISQAVRMSAGVTLAAGLLVLAGGIAAARRRHIYDAIILKVLGAGRRRILKTFLLEYALLGSVTVFIAAVLGTIAAFGVLHYIMNIGWSFSAPAIAIVVVLCLSVTVTAGYAGTWYALRRKPAPYLRNK